MSIKRRKRRLREQRLQNVLILLLFLTIAAISGGKLCRDYWQREKEEERYEQLRIQVKIIDESPSVLNVPESESALERENILEEEAPSEERVYCRQEKDFEKLLAVNPDIYAWIEVPGTNINHPVLYSETDNYYLSRNLDLSEGYPGCIYSNACNSREFTDFITVIYGHNLTRDRMFGSLHFFEDEECFAENQKIVIHGRNKRLTYEILAAVHYTDIYIPFYFNILDAEGRDMFWETICAQSGEALSQVRETSLEEKDRLLVLSTCVRNKEEERYLVVGRLTEEAYYLPDNSKSGSPEIKMY